MYNLGDVSILNNCVFAGVTGSRLYGTFLANSDIDIRGVQFEPEEAVLGLESFSQLEFMSEDRMLDVVLYGLGKFFKLALVSNPTAIDMLFSPRNYWVESSPTWELIYSKRHCFLSRDCKRTFQGYAKSMMSRVRRDRYTNGHFDRKDAAHLVRLYLKSSEILSTHDYNPVLSGNDREIVRGIMHGGVDYHSIVNLVEEEAILPGEKAGLQEKPDRVAAQDLLINIRRELLCG